MQLTNNLSNANPGQPEPLLSAVLNHDKYPSLNGLRGVSILMVVVSHLRFSWNPWYHIVFNGPLGVGMFFVISGFLITTLCLKEIRQEGRLSLRAFYIRRGLRILPVAYLYIFIVFLLDKLFHLHLPYFQYLAALFYMMNFSYFIRNGSTVEMGHFWSLATEEQFYIIFPFVLKKSRKLFGYCVGFIVLALPLICTLQQIFPAINGGVAYGFTHYLIKFQSIAVGCLLALLAFNNRLDGKWLFAQKFWGNIIAIILIYALQFDPFYTLGAVYSNLVIALLIGYIILTNIIKTNDWVYRVLNSKILKLIGTLSYSIYIWQQIFTFGDDRLPAVFQTFPYNIGFLIVIPCISYYGYERYFLKLKQRFTVLKTKKTR